MPFFCSFDDFVQGVLSHWFALDRFTIADIALGSIVKRCLEFPIERPAYSELERWQAAINATWRDPRGPYARVDVTGMDAFYYDLPPNNTRSSPYGLVNGKLGWETERYEVYLWGRNLLNKDYTVRGFYFGDEPPNFPNKLYTQLGDPRNWGVHFTVRY